MKKTVVISIVALLLCLAAVGGTVAWLTAADSVTNTFTVGKINIELTEPEWTDESKIYPGAIIPKNPTITVKANSEDCYVYAMIDNKLNKTIPGSVTLNLQSGWTLIGTDDSKTAYRYNGIVSLNGSDQPLSPLFTAVTVSGTTVTELNINLLDDQNIEIKAYAHQSNATNQANADTAALAHFGM